MYLQRPCTAARFGRLGAVQVASFVRAKGALLPRLRFPTPLVGRAPCAIHPLQQFREYHLKSITTTGARWVCRAARTARSWVARPGLDLHCYFLQGVAYKLGTGAVTLLILWFQSRH